METTLFQLPGTEGDPNTPAAPTADLGLEFEETALDLRLHCTGLAYFFGGFTPRPDHARQPAAKASAADR